MSNNTNYTTAPPPDYNEDMENRKTEREMFKKIGVKSKHLSYEEWYAEFVTEK